MAGGGSRAQRRFVAQPHSVIPGMTSLLAGTGNDELTKPYEFGSNTRDEFTTYTRRSKTGGTHRVTRRTKRQLPESKLSGWVAYPAANRLGSRVFSMWGALINKVTHDALEGKS